MDKSTNVIHLKGLNGIRAIAALSVIIAHITGDLQSFGLDDSIFGLDSNGARAPILMASYGVTMFFALSGFLITYLLLIEKKKKKSIDIKKFYIRRILRIWPLYYFYILLVVGVYLIFRIDYNEEMMPFYILLAANIPLIIQSSLPFIGHLWSIGVEEQFYLFWPWIFKKSHSKLLRNSMIFFFVFYLIKVFSWFYGFNIMLTAMTVSRFNIMIMGCIVALLYYKKNKILTYISTKGVQIFCWVILLFAALNKVHLSSSLFDHEFMGFITLCIIIGQIERKNYIIDLDNKVLDFIGKISFGIYVYHPILIFLSYYVLGEFKESKPLNYFIVYSLIITFTILISHLSYKYLEKPFIEFKAKYQIAKSKA